jgi:FlaA1/EpsC-like NDP-sugar epimerase
MNFKNKIVCVTGAGGSIGSEICRQLVKAGVAELRLISLTENGLYEITKQLKYAEAKIVGILGSVLDPHVCHKGVRGADIVIHAAAHKHVPICEENALAAIENNVIGTYILAGQARMAGVGEFILVSTDKAVNPTSIMGATKRVAEKVMCDIMQSVLPRSTTFRIVRFGNVMDSAGSVLPLWRDQVRQGGPVTLTDKRCERYFMTIPDAASLVLGVLDLPPAVGPFVFQMGEPVNMYYLAEGLIRSMRGVNDPPIAIKEIGLRPGEKLTEELTYTGFLQPTAVPKIMFVIEEVGGRISDTDMNLLNDAVLRNDVVGATRWLWRLAK